jgi:hypothetical protein
LRDPGFFVEVFAFRGRVVWPNLFSLCPHFLASRVATAGPELRPLSPSAEAPLRLSSALT